MSVIQASTKPAIVPVSFDTAAVAIVRQFVAYDKTVSGATGKLTAVITREFQAFIDKWHITNGRNEHSVKALGKAITGSQVVIDAVAVGGMHRKTFTEYAQSAMRALHYGVPFSADLKNNPDMGLPWGKAGKGASAPKAGKVVSTSRADLDKTISKALAQARALGLTEFAADMLDLTLESLDGFNETILDK